MYNTDKKSLQFVAKLSVPQFMAIFWSFIISLHNKRQIISLHNKRQIVPYISARSGVICIFFFYK